MSHKKSRIPHSLIQTRIQQGVQEQVDLLAREGRGCALEEWKRQKASPSILSFTLLIFFFPHTLFRRAEKVWYYHGAGRRAGET